MARFATTYLAQLDRAVGEHWTGPHPPHDFLLRRDLLDGRLTASIVIGRVP